jgi:hypothetical protein
MIRNCVRCGDIIPQDRIECLPDTCLCVECSDAVGGDYIVTIITEEDGSVSFRKERREITPLFGCEGLHLMDPIVVGDRTDATNDPDWAEFQRQLTTVQ